ncbi:uncharacterized protein LOC122611763 [Drosophila teissieri]|uniref:uncharacterized protein LOC122611763 n=1 Tax=Drosophila teissieri TaxID=7243 RepID=UPI001CB9E958|nr:uncharacterized protein LOC122611763 [Drosophila teissieri]
MGTLQALGTRHTLLPKSSPDVKKLSAGNRVILGHVGVNRSEKQQMISLFTPARRYYGPLELEPQPLQLTPARRLANLMCPGNDRRRLTATLQPKPARRSARWYIVAATRRQASL